MLFRRYTTTSTRTEGTKHLPLPLARLLGRRKRDSYNFCV